MRDNTTLRVMSGIFIILGFYIGIVSILPLVLGYIMVINNGGTALFGGMTHQAIIWYDVYSTGLWVFIICLILFSISSLYVYMYVPFMDYPYPESVLEWIALIAINVGYKAVYTTAYVIIFVANFIWIPIILLLQTIRAKFKR